METQSAELLFLKSICEKKKQLNSVKPQKFIEKFLKFCIKKNLDIYRGKEEASLNCLEKWWYMYFRSAANKGFNKPPFKIIDDNGKEGFVSSKEDVFESYNKFADKDDELSNIEFFKKLYKLVAFDTTIANRTIKGVKVLMFKGIDDQRAKWLENKPDWKFDGLGIVENFLSINCGIKLANNTLEINIEQVLSYLNKDHTQKEEEECKEQITEKVGYIYLIRERERVKCNENCFKIGKTEIGSSCMELRRLAAYKKEGQVIQLIQCNQDDVNKIEQEIINDFKVRFKLVDGRETFEGDCKMMQKIIMLTMLKYSM